ncbi:MAG: hypothetical protein BIFFINMI_00012 [Phycisphaerae bacterium]|nr:hypothetical protein [Phycisphaerae bacterium]
MTAIRPIAGCLCAVALIAVPLALAGCATASPADDPYAQHVNAALANRPQALAGPPRILAAGPSGDQTPVVLTAWAAPAQPVQRPAPASSDEAAIRALSRSLNAPARSARVALADDKSALDEPVPGQPPRRGTAPPPRAAEPSAAGRSPNAPAATFAQTLRRDLAAAPMDLWLDTKGIATLPNLAILLAAGGASAAARWINHGGDGGSLDHQVDQQFGKHNVMERDWNEAFGAVGNPISHFLFAGAAYAYGAWAGNDESYSLGKTLLSAQIINGLATVALKGAAMNDHSPNGESWAWPSGHTSAVFTTAAVLEVRYGWKAGVPAYALASLAAFQRIDTREHWLSDVIFGAAMGIVIGRSVAQGHELQVAGWHVMPYAGSQGGGVLLVKTMK